jgi:hypothetical protein
LAARDLELAGVSCGTYLRAELFLRPVLSDSWTGHSALNRAISILKTTHWPSKMGAEHGKDQNRFERTATNPASTQTPPPPDPPLGRQETFTDDLVLKQYNRKKPKHGLPKEEEEEEEDRLAGIHSGTLTLLRKAQPGDRFYQPNTYILVVLWCETH